MKLNKSYIIDIIREEIDEFLGEVGLAGPTVKVRKEDGFAVATATGPAGTVTKKHKIRNPRQQGLAVKRARYEARKAYIELAAQAK
tara:strand:- start:64 stop:321 length:258 start_codon:yes stop_codon:yes gene_type:complete